MLPAVGAFGLGICAYAYGHKCVGAKKVQQSEYDRMCGIFNQAIQNKAGISEKILNKAANVLYKTTETMTQAEKGLRDLFSMNGHLNDEFSKLIYLIKRIKVAFFISKISFGGGAYLLIRHLAPSYFKTACLIGLGVARMTHICISNLYDLRISKKFKVPNRFKKCFDKMKKETRSTKYHNYLFQQSESAQ